MMMLLMNRGADLRARTREGDTPLHVAASSGHVLATTCLLEKSHSLALSSLQTAVNRLGHTPLMKSVMRGTFQMTRCMLEDAGRTFTTRVEHPSSIVEVETNMGWTLLSLAVRAATMTREERDKQVGGGGGGGGGGGRGAGGEGKEGEEEEDPRDSVVVLEMVRKYEPDVEMFTKSGLSPLILACGDGLLAVVEYLLDAFQCDPNSQNDTGFAPLHAAARGGHDAIVLSLLRHGADLSIEDLEGWTSLHFAAKAGHATTCGTLVKEGGKDLLSIKNVRGESAARVAFKWGKSEVLETLSYYEEE